MDKINGGQTVYGILKANGIDTVFGLLGGSMLELYDALYHGGDIAYVGARDERAAGHMADAWARMTGKPGVVLGAQAGPGVVNLVTAVAEAHLAYAPLVVIAGAITRADQAKDTFQEVDQVAIFAPICKRSVMVTEPSRLGPMLEDALRLANTGRRGPVVLHVPRDLFAAEGAATVPVPVRYAQAGPAAPDQVAAIAELIGGAERPVIFAGGGFKWGGGRDALSALAEALEVPVVASTGHADVMRHGHRWFAGQGGPRGNRVASRLTREADVMLVLGARLGFNSTFHSHQYVGADTRIAHVDIDGAAVGRYFPAEIAAQGDARLTAEAGDGAGIPPGLRSLAGGISRRYGWLVARAGGGSRHRHLADASAPGIGGDTGGAARGCDCHARYRQHLFAGGRPSGPLRAAVADYAAGFRAGGIWVGGGHRSQGGSARAARCRNHGGWRHRVHDDRDSDRCVAQVADCDYCAG